MMVIGQYNSLELACEKTRELNGVIIRGNRSMSPGNRSFWIKKVRLNKKIKFLVVKTEESVKEFIVSDKKHDRESLIKNFKKNGVLDIYLRNNEEVYVKRLLGSKVVAERRVWDKKTDNWKSLKSYGFFKSIESLLENLKKERVLCSID